MIRKLCIRYIDDNPIRLGGDGIVCQIDESLFCHKSKYNRGISSEQIWVFGICDTSFVPARGYLQVVPNRASSTLLPIIEQVCKKGTIIHSDEWKSYKKLHEIGFLHETVNHSREFSNRESGFHTQHSESYWAKMKVRGKEMKGFRKNLLNDYLAEYMWRDNIPREPIEKILDL
ncbi:hypothetical protein GJ496_008045 [Pomphorhynchus laevis]|nr:hypothetical protein GJ496_008045 [Pomphorhynchus laevis]